MSEAPSNPPSFQPGRKWSISLQVGCSILALVAIMVMVNYLAARHFTRVEMSAGVRHELTPLTHRVLELLSQPVKVIVFYDRREPLYGAVSELLQQYHLRSPFIQVEHVDYVLSRGLAQEVQTKYRLDPDAGDRIIFESGGQVRTVYARDLSEYDYAAMFRGEEVRRTGFKGEQLFTSALYSMAEGVAGQVYFLLGHGEHHPFNPDDQYGYSRFKALLEENNIRAEHLDTLEQGEIPEACQLLIIAGPVQAFSPLELERLERYLDAGGRLFVLFSFPAAERTTGLENFLARWGVEVGQNSVLDEVHGRLGETQEVLASEFGTHAIVSPLRRSRLSLVKPRSIRARASGPQSADAPRVTELVFTSERGVVISEAGSSKGRPIQQGAIPLMVAVEKGTIAGLSTTRGATRMVVAGESYFLSNTLIQRQANQDLARNAVNWLLDREALIEGIGPKAIQEYQITLTESQMSRLRWLFLGLAPGTVFLAGGLVWLRRRT